LVIHPIFINFGYLSLLRLYSNPPYSYMTVTAPKMPVPYSRFELNYYTSRNVLFLSTIPQAKVC